MADNMVIIHVEVLNSQREQSTILQRSLTKWSAGPCSWLINSCLSQEPEFHATNLIPPIINAQLLHYCWFSIIWTFLQFVQSELAEIQHCFQWGKPSKIFKFKTLSHSTNLKLDQSTTWDLRHFLERKFFLKTYLWKCPTTKYFFLNWKN